MMRTIPVVCGTLVVTASAWGGAPGRPTYAKDVAPIMNANCVACHRPGDIAPMSLTSYDEVRPWAKAIAKNVGERVMPPWHADKGVRVFENDRSLSDDEVATIVRWVEQGAKQGDPKDMPALPEFPRGEWKLGAPDLVVTFDKVELPAGGPDQFYNLTQKLSLPQDQWVRAVEVQPSNRKVTHHVIAYQTEKADAPPEGWLGAWAAGAEPMEFPDKMGRLIKKDGIIIGDMHYHPADTPQIDQTRIGLYFAQDAEIEKEVINLWLDNRSFEIPAGNPSFKASSTYTFPQDSIILSVMPHMHYRGKRFSYTATYPDGRSEVLMSTSAYDFNWQTNYIFKKPIKVPSGTRIDCVAEWDNSADNPRNPDPAKNVTFGNASTDEMMIGFVDYIAKDGVRPESASDRLGEILAQMAAEHLGEVYDVQFQDADPEADPPTPTALHLPREGEGFWHILIGARMFEGTLTSIAWQGNSVKAKAKFSISGTNDFDATIDQATGKIDGTLSDKGEIVANFHGTRVE